MTEEKPQPVTPWLVDRFKNRKLTKKLREIEMLKLQVEEAKVFLELKKLRTEIDKE